MCSHILQHQSKSNSCLVSVQRCYVNTVWIHYFHFFLHFFFISLVFLVKFHIRNDNNKKKEKKKYKWFSLRALHLAFIFLILLGNECQRLGNDIRFNANHFFFLLKSVSVESLRTKCAGASETDSGFARTLDNFRSHWFWIVFVFLLFLHFCIHRRVAADIALSQWFAHLTWCRTGKHIFFFSLGKFI